MYSYGICINCDDLHVTITLFYGSTKPVLIPELSTRQTCYQISSHVHTQVVSYNNTVFLTHK